MPFALFQKHGMNGELSGFPNSKYSSFLIFIFGGGEIHASSVGRKGVFGITN